MPPANCGWAATPATACPRLCKRELDALKGTTVLIPIYDALAARHERRIPDLRLRRLQNHRLEFSGIQDPSTCGPALLNGELREAFRAYFERWVSVDSSFDLGGPATNATPSNSSIPH